MNITSANYPHVKEYVVSWKKAIQLAKDQPELIIRIDWNMEKTAADTLKWFISALNNRINSRGQDYQRGKNDCQDYYWQARRDQRAIRDRLSHRLIIRQFETKECRNRFSYLLFKEE
jgi:hypothetical protein